MGETEEGCKPAVVEETWIDGSKYMSRSFEVRIPRWSDEGTVEYDGFGHSLDYEDVAESFTAECENNHAEYDVGENGEELVVWVRCPQAFYGDRWVPIEVSGYVDYSYSYTGNEMSSDDVILGEDELPEHLGPTTIDTTTVKTL